MISMHFMKDRLSTRWLHWFALGGVLRGRSLPFITAEFFRRCVMLRRKEGLRDTWCLSYSSFAQLWNKRWRHSPSDSSWTPLHIGDLDLVGMAHSMRARPSLAGNMQFSESYWRLTRRTKSLLPARTLVNVKSTPFHISILKRYYVISIYILIVAVSFIERCSWVKSLN